MRRSCAKSTPRATRRSDRGADCEAPSRVSHEAATGGAEEREAAEKLLDVVERGVRDLFRTLDSDGPDGWKRSYNEQRGTLADRPHLDTVPVGGGALDEWCEQAEARGEAGLVEAAQQRQALREDAETIKAIRSAVLRRDEYLRNGAILRAVEAEVAAFAARR